MASSPRAKPTESQSATLFSVWVTLTEHKWVTPGDRRGLPAGKTISQLRSFAERTQRCSEEYSTTALSVMMSWEPNTLEGFLRRRELKSGARTSAQLCWHSCLGSARSSPLPLLARFSERIGSPNSCEMEPDHDLVARIGRAETWRGAPPRLGPPPRRKIGSRCHVA